MNRDLEEAKAALLECFPNSFVNGSGVFIAHLRSNTYFILHNCETPLDIELSFGYADLKEINLDNTEFELSGLPAEGDFSGSIQAITNNMPSLRPNAPESMLY